MFTDCIFCKIIQGQIPAKLIMQNSDLIVIADIAPKAKIHYLIIPKKHLPTLMNFESQDLTIGSEIIVMAQELAQLYSISSFKLVRITT